MGIVFQYIPDKEQAWEDLHRLTSDEEKSVREKAAKGLGIVFQYIPDKEQAWEDLHKLTSDEDKHMRLSVAGALSTAFRYIPDKQQAWEDLVRFTSDKDSYIIRWRVAEALGTAFQYIPDKEQAWEDLHKLTSDKNSDVRWSIAKTFGTFFQYVPNKQQAWEDLIILTTDKNRDVKLSVAELLGTVFQHTPDKQQAWEDLHRLTLDKDSYMRWRVAGAFGTVFQYIPDKEQAWEDLHKLTSDEDRDVRVNAYHSSGRISIYEASESDDEEAYLEKLNKAIEFFEKATKEPMKANPSKFCFQFYRSFYIIISAKKQEAKDEVAEFLLEAKKEIGRSENKKLLLNAIENLANALKEVQNLENMDLTAKKGELNFYRKYCEQATELMKNTEEKAPFATATVRKGLPFLHRKIKSLVNEIQEKSKIACKESKGTDTEKIACDVSREVQKWEIGSPEEVTLYVESFISTLESKIPRLPENERIFKMINESKDQKNLKKLLKNTSELIEIIPQITIDPERIKPTIGIITALPKEYAAFNILLKNKNDKYKVPGFGAGRRYCLGEILTEEGNKHNLVLVIVGMGNNIAATRASLLLEHFPNIKSIIMVGIAGGVPNPNKVDDHVRLGDIVVSNENGVIQYDFIKQEIREITHRNPPRPPTNPNKVDDHVRLGDIVVSNENGVIQYDFIKQEIREITHRNPPRPPSASLLEAVRYLEAEEILGGRPWDKYIDQSLSVLKTTRPSEDKDTLYSLDNQEEVIQHPEDSKRIKDQPRVFIGPIASANILQKDPKARDELRNNFKVKAIEMVAAWPWNTLALPRNVETKRPLGCSYMSKGRRTARSAPCSSPPRGPPAHRLGLVVRHHHGGDPDAPLQGAHLDLHVVAQLGVERAHRLVEQQDRRPDHQRPGQRDALLLAARQLARLAVRQRLEAHQVQRLRRPAASSPAARAASPARTPRSRPRSCAETARSSGTRCPRPARAAAAP